MHDLRKKVLLESSKTQSRKARAKGESPRSSARASPVASPIASRATSQAGSHPGSAYASEDEAQSYNGDYYSYESSLAGYGESDSDDHDGTVWQDSLRARIAELADRKGSSVQEREATLAKLLYLVRHHYARGDVNKSVSSALLKSAQDGSSKQERVLALQALSATLLTSPSESYLDTLLAPLQTICRDDPDEQVKAAAAYALVATLAAGGGLAAEVDDALNYLLDIVESDGHSVEAGDSGLVVAAALQAWSFAATTLTTADLATRPEAEQSLEAFLEQLDSTDSDVQINAGINIAQLLEAIRTHEESEDGEDAIIDSLQYYRHRLTTRATELMRDSSKNLSQTSRKHLRYNFRSIMTSLERGVGPGYSTATREQSARNSEDDANGAADLGYREEAKVGKVTILIDSWAVRARVLMLQRIFGGGFGTHFEQNPCVHTLLGNASIKSAQRRSKSNR